MLIANADKTHEKSIKNQKIVGGGQSPRIYAKQITAFDHEQKAQVLQLARSKSEEFLKKLNLKRSTFYNVSKKKSPDKYSPIKPEDFSLEHQGPNADIFLK